MAVAFNTSSGAGATTGSTVTVSHTAAGAKRLALAEVIYSRNGADWAQTITGVTYGGVAMTDSGFTASISNGGGGTYRFMTKRYYLINPSTSAQNVVATISGNLDEVTNIERLNIFVTSWTAANQTTPIGGTGSGGTVGATVTAPVTITRTGSAIMGGVIYSGNTMTTAGGSTELATINNGHQGIFNYKVYQTGSASLVWDYNGGNSIGWVVEIKTDDIATSVSDTVTCTDLMTALRARFKTILNSFTLTDTVSTLIDPRTWVDAVKSASSWLAGTKHSSSWGNQNKDSSNWTNQDKS